MLRLILEFLRYLNSKMVLPKLIEEVNQSNNSQEPTKILQRRKWEKGSRLMRSRRRRDDKCFAMHAGFASCSSIPVLFVGSVDFPPPTEATEDPMIMEWSSCYPAPTSGEKMLFMDGWTSLREEWMEVRRELLE